MRVLLLVSALAALAGCAPQQQVYGFRGPAIQDDIYHPIVDPLFKDEK